MDTKRLHQLFLLNLCLQLFDGVATYEGLRHHWAEGNPILVSWMPYLGAGGTLDLTQDIVPGNTDVLFDQTSHYSFRNVGVLSPNNAITVYIGGERVLGFEPPLSVLPDCAFIAGLNLGGPAVTIGTQSLDGSADASFSFAGASYTSSSPKPFPATDAATTTLLASALTLTGTDSATWSVSNGRYWAYAWLTSAAGMDVGTLAIQDNPADKFIGLSISSKRLQMMMTSERMSRTTASCSAPTERRLVLRCKPEIAAPRSKFSLS